MMGAAADCTLKVIPGGGHGFARAVDRQAIIAFLEAQEDADKGAPPAQP